jgi:hypothetical protein
LSDEWSISPFMVDLPGELIPDTEADMKFTLMRQ